jgi:predicted SprT family Zn-dependent metalloprotease
MVGGVTQLAARSRHQIRGIADDALTRWCADACAALGMAGLGGDVRVLWNPRMRTAAGRAFWPTRVIELNPLLQTFDRGEIDRTLKHELAHLIAYHRAGRRRIQPHGEEWRTACAQLGIPGEKACHSLPLPRRRQHRRLHYACPACQRVIQRVRPFPRRVACADCCRRHAGGRFDKRFMLTPVPATAVATSHHPPSSP